MSVTITAVAGPVPPAPDVITERTLQEFVTNLQNSAAAMPQLANPAALASELSGFLRGYVERARNAERGMQSLSITGGDSADLVQTAAAGDLPADLHGGPARERLEPAGADSSVLSSVTRAGLADLERVHALLLDEMNSILEGTLLTNGTSQVIHSLDSLLRGQ